MKNIIKYDIFKLICWGLVGFELRLDLDAEAGHRLRPFVEPTEPIRMAGVGIQVEAELEPYRSTFVLSYTFADRSRCCRPK